MRALYNALAVEEFNVDDGVETYAIHRDPEDEGAYQIYEQYGTAAAARRHLTGPKSRAAWSSVLARVIAPFERVLLEPLGVFGKAKPVGDDVTGDEAWRFTIRVLPEHADIIDETMQSVLEATSIDEFPFGEVKSYTGHRIAGDPGGYVMYEHFTALGSARHATGPTLVPVAEPFGANSVTPFARQLLHPLFAYGIDHRSWKKPAWSNGRVPNAAPASAAPASRANYQQHGRIG